jgi:ABC-type polysaccharide/polyol phosphate transport system ATPase subunit
MTSIVLDRVCVDFPIYDSDRSLRKLLFHTSIGGAVSRDAMRGNRLTVRALENITFTLNEGDRLGLVGHNGAGKSTLLRVMSGAYRPSSGRIQVDGVVSALLSLGTGVDPEDTGYTNIYNACLLMGMIPAQIRDKMDEIADFSELGEYLHVPVRTYSTGMHMRLSFAIATSLYPDILLLDEVLGAGDAAFMIKAGRRIEQLMSRASLLVLAAHANDVIRRFCNKAVLLRSGRIEEYGPVETTIAAYERMVAAASEEEAAVASSSDVVTVMAIGPEPAPQDEREEIVEAAAASRLEAAEQDEDQEVKEEDPVYEMWRINREALEEYCSDDRIARLLVAESLPGDERLTCQRWLAETPAKRLIYDMLYGDLLGAGGRRVLDVGGGLTALTRRLALRHRYELVDLMAHDPPEVVSGFRASAPSAEFHCCDWWRCDFSGIYDVVIANDLFPNADQRLVPFLERVLPVAREVRLSLTYYNDPRFYLTKRLDAEEVLCLLAWDGRQTASALAPFGDRVEVFDQTYFASTGDSVFANGRQVVVLCLRGDRADG